MLEEPQLGSVPFHSSFSWSFGMGQQRLLYWDSDRSKVPFARFSRIVSASERRHKLCSPCIGFWVLFLARRGGLWPAFWSPFETSDWGTYPPNFVVSTTKSSLNGHSWCWRELWEPFCIGFGTFSSARDDDCGSTERYILQY